MTKKDNTEGMNSALVYISRRDMHPAKGSSLKKLRRAARIAAGLRPLRRKQRQFFPVDIIFKAGEPFLVERPADLHFTKGYRPAIGVADRHSKISNEQAVALFGRPIDPRPAVLAA